MKNISTGSRYFIFKCQHNGCNEDIPVALHSFAHTRERASAVTCNEKDEGANKTSLIDITCPYCNSLNHFTIMNSHKEVNRHVFEAENKAINAMQYNRFDRLAQV
jgi:phage FluMu protein Com